MPKLKPKKTLLKRIKITKGGKVLKKQNRTGHLKRKWTSNKKHRKNRMMQITSVGYFSKVKSMIGQFSKGL